MNCSFLSRTDYWISQGRKFCEFCKCSIADNKPSIQFHENGKKHKENVAKRLTEMQKKASKEAKEALDFDKEMKRIEAAALKAYANDVKSNADFTSRLIRSGRETLPTPELVSEGEPKAKAAKKRPPPPAARKKWMEAVSDDGQTYYWNADTGESAWEPPAEGYLSLADQEKQKINPSSTKNFQKKKKPKKGNFSKEGATRTARERVKQPEEAKPSAQEPVLQSRPIGAWRKVEEETKKEEAVVDLQLPRQEMIPISVPKLREDLPRTFKEKVFTSGITSSVKQEIAFKKRKIASDTKKNIRQRLSDD